MTIIQRGLPAILLLLLSSCATSMKISSNYDHTARFTGLKTYAWVPGAQSGLEDPRINAKFVDPQVRRDVDAELSAKGYTKQPVGTADFLMSYHVSLSDGSSTQRVGAEPLYDAFSVTIADGVETTRKVGNPDAVSYMDQYRVGALQLRITDPKTKKIIWHGAAEARLVDNAAPEQKAKRLNEAIHLILERFPPK